VRLHTLSPAVLDPLGDGGTLCLFAVEHLDSRLWPGEDRLRAPALLG
jgi:hypothetical protein